MKNSSSMAPASKQYFCLFRGANAVAWLQGLIVALFTLVMWIGLERVLPMSDAAWPAVISVLLFLSTAIIAAIFWGSLAGISAGIFGLFLLNWQCFCFFDALGSQPILVAVTFGLFSLIVVSVALYRSRVSKAREEYLQNLLLSLSHEIKTPLAAITGAVSSFQQMHNVMDQSDQEALLNIIANEARRLDRHATNIVDMSRIHHQQMTPKAEPVLSESVIENILQDYQTQKVTIHFKKSGGLPLIVADKALLAKAIRHVIENAINHSPKEGIITLQSALTEKLWTLEISDQGEGFSQAFSTGCDSTRRAMLRDSQCSGLGLGLSISNEIALLHHGEMEICNAQTSNTKGGLVRFSFPLHHASKDAT